MQAVQNTQADTQATQDMQDTQDTARVQGLPQVWPDAFPEWAGRIPKVLRLEQKAQQALMEA